MIAVECFPDEALLRHLGVPVARIMHAMGKGNVLNALAAHSATIAVIDQDPGSTEPPQLTAFSRFEDCGSLSLMTCPTERAIKVITIRPRLEEWLLARAQASRIVPGHYGLPDNARELHKRKRYDRLIKFRGFVLALLAVDPEMQALQSWLTSRQ